MAKGSLLCSSALVDSVLDRDGELMLLEKALDGLPGGFDIFCEPFCPFIELSSRVLV
eukprot:CAMPEP_0175118768 /NCGR_PEP_ID=MMETSP0086_2-20121207/19748_1 /TAXON_ID=136419 /ORGANISM="Unknown Unknown, Strain D1" /LENGTH=56 /DNA_ID=CAMNT_0016399871 /DNA_START=647 /DNA_END=814 /DNA_ORIENTATION=-